MLSPRPTIAAMAGYTPGRSPAQVQQMSSQEIIKLSSNESLWGPSEHAVAAAQARLAAMSRYPEMRPTDLLQRLSQNHGFLPDQVMLGNGADELIRLTGSAYLEPGTNALVPTPSFSQYAYATRLAGADVVPVNLNPEGSMDLNATLAAITPLTRIIFLCSPNNPTGGMVTQMQWNHFLNQLPDHVLVVFDAAYQEFVDHPDAADVGASIRAGYPVVMLRTFSKLYALAGLRIGWAAGPAEVIAILQKTREPFSINIAAESAALAALEDVAYYRDVRHKTLNARLGMIKSLDQRGIQSYASQANFLTWETPLSDAGAMAQLLEHRGFLVRPTTNFGLPGYIRVTVAPEDILERFWVAWDDAKSSIDKGSAKQ